MSDHRPFRVFLEAGRYMASLSPQFELPVAIWVSFMGAVLWSDRKLTGEVPMSLEELAARTGKPPSTISQHLRYLGVKYRFEKPGMGLVETHEHPLNGRMKTFGLTPKGRAAAEHLRYIYNRQDSEL